MLEVLDILSWRQSTKSDQIIFWSGTTPIQPSAHTTQHNQRANTTMRYIRAFGILLVVFGPGVFFPVVFFSVVFSPAASATDQVKRNVSASAQAPLPESAQGVPVGWQVENTQWNFDRIFQYSLLDRTLPDGTHPAWITYQAAETIVRVDMPSLAMCMVAPGSVTDWDVIKSGHADVISRSDKDWHFVVEIRGMALQHRLTADMPEQCGR